MQNVLTVHCSFPKSRCKSREVSDPFITCQHRTMLPAQPSISITPSEDPSQRLLRPSPSLLPSARPRILLRELPPFPQERPAVSGFLSPGPALPDL